MNRKGVQKLWNVVNVSISKSRKAQLHEKSFSWFEGIGAFPQQAKKAFCTYKCTACQLAIFMLRELNFRQELSTKGC